MGQLNPLLVAAIGVAAGAVFWGLSFLLPAIADAIGILIKAIGGSIGLSVAVASTGFATASTAASWLPTVATAGVAAAGISTTYLVVAKIVEKGKEKPYEWLLPALGLLAVFFVDLTKDQLFSTITERAIYGLCTGLFTVGGGFLLLQARWYVRLFGTLLPFIPSLAVWLLLLREHHIPGAFKDFILAGSFGAIGMVGTFLLGTIIVILGLMLPQE